MSRGGSRLLPAMLAVCALAGGAGASENSTYTYDALGRLVATSHSGGPRSGTTVASRYDEAGNRAAVAVDQPLPAVPSNAVTFTISGAGTVTKGGTATFTVTKAGAAGSTATVDFATVNGTAVSPTHYTATSGTLSFRRWETTKSVSVGIFNDGMGSPARQFTMNLSTPSSGGALGTPSSGAATIAAAPYAPTPVTDSVSVGVCLTKTINVIANDTDPGGNYPLTLVSVGSSTLADLSVVSGTTVNVTGYGAAGGGTASYVVRNSAGVTATGTLNVTVTNGQGCN